MSSTKQVRCALTGQTTTLSKDYLFKKIEEYGSEENLLKFFVTKKAKQLITRGYSVDEIRKILNVTEPNLLEPSSMLMREIVTFHDGGKSSNINRRLDSGMNFMMQSSDTDVVEFINNVIKQYEN